MARRKAATPKEPTFEQRLARLERIVETLESGDVGLDESLKLYGEGADLLKACRKTLGEAEKKISKLTETAGGELQEEPFDPQE
ncbi:MAG TPA: exodeoxyribonuclease VII small subunit [Phycisphaerae bacterium]|nr:exodeoxyribonuclease VII small subunit [Phycisphaerae bacterium]